MNIVPLSVPAASNIHGLYDHSPSHVRLLAGCYGNVLYKPWILHLDEFHCTSCMTNEYILSSTSHQHKLHSWDEYVLSSTPHLHKLHNKLNVYWVGNYWQIAKCENGMHGIRDEVDTTYLCMDSQDSRKNKAIFFSLTKSVMCNKTNDKPFLSSLIL